MKPRRRGISLLVNVFMNVAVYDLDESIRDVNKLKDLWRLG